jgi:hypothetical protein
MIANREQREVERAVWVYLICLVGLTCIAWAPFLMHGMQRADFPLSQFAERFGDLDHFARSPQKLAYYNLEDTEHLAGTLFPRNYGPLAVLVYLFLLEVCTPYAIVVFLSIVISSLFVGAFLLWRAARRSVGYRPFMAWAIFGTSLFALPTAETELRGNIEGLLWIGSALGVALLFSRRWSRSATVLGIASAIKPYPLIWLVLMVSRRKYKQAALGVIALGLATVMCLGVLGTGNPAAGLARISENSDSFFKMYIVGLRPLREAAEDHSLFQTSKSVVRVMQAHGFDLPPQNYDLQSSVPAAYTLLYFYTPFAALALLGTLWRIWRQPFLTQVFSLAICLTLLPYMAIDYTMTILYLPMGLFLLFLLRDVASGRATISQGRILTILIGCAWLMSPQPMFALWAGDARSIVLAALLLVVMNTSMPMAIDRDEAEPSSAPVSVTSKPLIS